MDGLLDLAAKLEFGMTRFFEPDTEAHLKLGGLSIWVDGREHPHSDDGDDGNWLIIYARVEAPRRLGRAKWAVVAQGRGGGLPAAG